MEKYIEVGDIVTFYPTLLHGVSPVDEEASVDWSSTKGRWLMVFSSLQSDHVEDRVTAGTIKWDYIMPNKLREFTI